MTAVTTQGDLAGRRPLDVGAMLKEAVVTALVALALMVPLVGFRTVDSVRGLTVTSRFEEVVVVVFLVFIGRIGLILTREGRALPVLVLSVAAAILFWFLDFPAEVMKVLSVVGAVVIAIRAATALGRQRSTLSHQARETRTDRRKAIIQDATNWLGPLGVLFAIALPFLPFADRSVIDIGILILTYVMLGWGLNIIVGYAGLLDLGYVAFYAVGAYSYALLAQYFGLSFWVCLPLAGLLAAMAGLILGFPVLRLRGDYFAIVTLGFGEIIRVVLLNWYEFTGGPNGIAGIPRPDFFGLAEFSRRATDGGTTFHEMFGLEYDPLQRIIFLYYLILILALLVNFFTLRIRKLPIGRAWEALREDDIACTALGINRTNIKLAAFMISAMWGGFAGSFFATRQGFISPESFTFLESAIILAIVVLGGMGSQVGIAIAALLVIGLPELFRELSEYRMVAFGLGMVLIMVWRPRGLLSHRDPTILLHPRKSARQKQADAEGRA
jgi:branched-chain amino acid transport system permease protein